MSSSDETPSEPRAMVATAARVEANRRNARKSTGPKTPEGKGRSRANAVKHGLCAEVVGLDGLEMASGSGPASASASSSPSNTFVAWLLGQVASLANRVEHAQAMQGAARERAARRAGVSWEDDRKLEAAVLGEQLAGRPGRVVERLRQTPQGCEWLVSRWAMLAHAADSGSGWTPGQAKLALDLLGTPAEFREGVEPGTEVDAEGRVTGPPLPPATLARREVEGLQARIAQIVDLDAADRAAAEAGLADDPEVRRLRRYEASLQRRLEWTLALLRGNNPDPQPTPEPTPPPDQPEPPTGHPEPEAEAEAEPEPGSAAARPTRAAGRAAKKLQKAEARREARRRKLEKLRA